MLTPGPVTLQANSYRRTWRGEAERAITSGKRSRLRDLTAALARVLGWDKGQTSVTVHSDKTVIVCNENRRAELIAQRQRLLAAEKPASGRTVDVAVRLQHKN